MLNSIINSQKKSTFIIELCVIMLGWHTNALLKFMKSRFDSHFNELFTFYNTKCMHIRFLQSDLRRYNALFLIVLKIYLPFFLSKTAQCVPWMLPSFRFTLNRLKI